MKVRFICLALMLLSTACSYRYRESDPQLDSARMMEELQNAQMSGAVVSSSNGVDPLMDSNTTVYYADAYAEGPGPMGTMNTVLAINDLSLIGVTTSKGNILGVQVFFLDNPTMSPRNQLIVGIYDATADQWVYSNFQGDGAVSGGEFRANMGSFEVRSYDTSGGDLSSSIQLRVFTTDGAYAGKFSILAGYR